MLTPRPATQADIEWMAPRLRKADQDEVLAGGSPSVLASLEEGLRISDAPLVGVDEDDNPVVIFGRCRMTDLSYSVWLLATDDIHKHRTTFLRQGRDYLARLHDSVPVLFNAVDERNTLHIQWLRWLGFIFIKRHASIGPEKRPFLEFVSYRPCVIQPSSQV
jgi:hypothetical protein